MEESRRRRPRERRSHLHADLALRAGQLAANDRLEDLVSIEYALGRSRGVLHVPTASYDRDASLLGFPAHRDVPGGYQEHHPGLCPDSDVGDRVRI